MHTIAGEEKDSQKPLQSLQNSPKFIDQNMRTAALALSFKFNTQQFTRPPTQAPAQPPSLHSYCCRTTRLAAPNADLLHSQAKLFEFAHDSVKVALLHRE